jgi:hypothetical protein
VVAAISSGKRLDDHKNNEKKQGVKSVKKVLDGVLEQGNKAS